ncbi:MAG: hypothetical protein Q4F13_14545, partial [Pseudomonadota bacterium]|nr:hypothetical protein [Pseudomonadota bacterium]
VQRLSIKAQARLQRMLKSVAAKQRSRDSGVQRLSIKAQARLQRMLKSAAAAFDNSASPTSAHTRFMSQKGRLRASRAW